MKKYVLVMVLVSCLLARATQKVHQVMIQPKRNRQLNQPQNIIRMNMPCWVYRDCAKCVKNG